jgi:hypothetical protein
MDRTYVEFAGRDELRRRRAESTKRSVGGLPDPRNRNPTDNHVHGDGSSLWCNLCVLGDGREFGGYVGAFRYVFAGDGNGPTAGADHGDRREWWRPGNRDVVCLGYVPITRTQSLHGDGDTGSHQILYDDGDDLCDLRIDEWDELHLQRHGHEYAGNVGGSHLECRDASRRPERTTTRHGHSRRHHPVGVVVSAVIKWFTVDDLSSNRITRWPVLYGRGVRIGRGNVMHDSRPEQWRGLPGQYHCHEWRGHIARLVDY